MFKDDLGNYAMEDIINKIQPFHFLITHYPILGSNNIKVASYREGKKKRKKGKSSDAVS